MIENIKILQTELNIKFSDKIEDNFPFIWLRDHAKDELNWDIRSNQRKTFTAKINTNLSIKEASILDNGKSLSILWSDLNSAINYSHDFLRENIGNKWVIIKTTKDKKGKYGRWLGEVFLGDRNINDLLVEKGLAEVYK